MNILLVHGRKLGTVPPVLNLIVVLLRNGHHVTVISEDEAEDFIGQRENLKTITMPKNEGNALVKAIDYFRRKNKIKKIIRVEMEHNDILWTTVESALRIVGSLAYQYKHIMMLTELMEDLPSIPIESRSFYRPFMLKLFPMHMKNYAKRSYRFVTSEYNRAHIHRAWWDLQELPMVWPNKPVDEDVDISKIPSEVQAALSEIKRERRKVILYQGTFLSDRDLDMFAQAIDERQEEYCFYIMGRDTPYRQHLSQTYKNIKYIPFIKPPYHLLITGSAHIGILPYKYTHIANVSVLNALYCAPNKIYEYAKYGIPMVGTDVPGLKMPFMQYHIGCCCQSNTAEGVLDAISQVEANYGEMSKNCHEFYNSVNLDQIASKILGENSGGDIKTHPLS